MALDDRDVSCRCSHRYWNWGWDIAPPRAFSRYSIDAGQTIYNNQVRSLQRSDCALAYTYSPSVPQNHSTTPAAAQILSDTSLAALILSNGDRHLFFQNNTGHIERAVRSATNSQWSTNVFLPLNINTPSPKNLTPMALTVDEGNSESETEVLIKS